MADPAPTRPPRAGGAPSAPASTGTNPADDPESLLARHQPVLAFDRRELFFPTSVERYVEACELWRGSQLIDPAPTVAGLDHRLGFDTHLRFVSAADRRNATVHELRRSARRIVSSRLGVVGLCGRVIDALLTLLAIIRPTTPKGTAAAAATKAAARGLHDFSTCYGRVVTTGDWLVLHYAWLYTMNDWRSGYRGMNDHEGDWEQAWIFCDAATQRPEWILASNHRHAGPGLRRAWNDPHLVRSGPRPVLFAGAGSHALFFEPGDYLTRIELPGLGWLGRLLGVGRRGRGAASLGIPFVDHAAGDGRVIADAAIVAMSDQPWCESYRGLWGLDSGDPLQSERGPSGPKFNRRGQLRRSWFDPLGHAGLDGLLPLSQSEAGSAVGGREARPDEPFERVPHDPHGLVAMWATLSLPAILIALAVSTATASAGIGATLAVSVLGVFVVERVLRLALRHRRTRRPGLRHD